MKKKLLLLTILSVGFICFSQNTYVPDDNFEQALIDLGYDSAPLDDYVPTNNINTVTELFINNLNISDLTGIEDFSALESLYCRNNLFTSIDMSNNLNLIELDCASNTLTSINISQNTLLTDLICFQTQLSYLDVSNNPNLFFLNCQDNLLTSLNVSENSNLGVLYCQDNLISSLVLCQNTSLFELSASNNNLSFLDIRNGNNINMFWFNTENNPDLTYIYVDDAEYSTNNWTDIDTTSSYVESNEECYNTSEPLTYVPDDNFEQALIDLGYDTSPLDDYVPTNNINTVTELNVDSKNIQDLTGIEDFTMLERLYCSWNQITNIDITSNANLEILGCNNNQLTSLISQNSNLIDIDCSNNLLSSIDITQNPNLNYLTCSNNFFTSIDVSQNILLSAFNCSNNLLTNINVSQNSNLDFFWCQNNQLANLSLVNNPNLFDFNCSNNLLTKLDIRSNLNENIAYYNSTSNPNLTCIYVDDADYSSTNWTDVDSTSTFVETEEECEELNEPLTYVPDDNFEQHLIDLGYDSGPLDDYVPTNNINTITNLDISLLSINNIIGIEDFVALENLNCFNNNISFFDISNNSLLKEISCGGNNITSIDVTQNLNLEVLLCSINELSSIDVSQNLLLRELRCGRNQLSNVDVRQNLNLEVLTCFNNNINSLDLSLNSLLQTLWCDVNSLTSLDLSQNSNLIDFKGNSNQLLTIDIRNGNNSNMGTSFITSNNPDLTCIYVDDSEYSSTNWLNIDSTTTFVESEEECSLLNCLITPVDEVNSISECYDYTLPSITNGSYYTETLGGGTLLNPGDIITTTQTIFIYTEDPSHSNCYSESSFNVIINESIDFALSQDNLEINILDLTVNMVDSSINYLYAVDNILNYQTSNVFNNLTIGEHVLYVKDENDCVEKTIAFTIDDTKLQIAGFFTPNNDGENDYWTINDTNNEIQNIYIFNRFGNIVATMLPNSQGWDGTFNGKNLPSGDYWYSINLVSGKTIKGNFSLIRRAY
ncbi:T9SS type B sorting domain-containing protein [Urechidicola croceus]|uniref:Ig-like domain-containing protein n=1 Tax=Urechidicola croceus TaxID=1850246 RepID=A0A1D8P959_9FLAO|nr:T9SS type B sorting domain-containing protein [Urechidicola croceus]AOW21103.1 hypothetical protein LPB138_10620 [Urechidicola croceus]